MTKLVLVRHGESIWNKENRFTGWTDVDLSEQGIQEARRAGTVLKKEGFFFDLAYTSVLKRAIRTLFLVQDEMDQLWCPTIKAWQLNERHYGSLQGLDKKEMARTYGEEQVFEWRRSFKVQPPPLALDDPRHPRFDPRYKNVPPSQLPGTEALANTIERVVPYWKEEIWPSIKSGQRVLIAAHGNSLRALVKYLDQISETEIMEVNIPTGIPLIYELDEQGRPLNHYYLGDPEAVRKATEAVAKQGKK